MIFLDTFFASRMGGEAILAELMAASRDGHLCIKTDQTLAPRRGIIQDKDRLYLERNWIFETRVIEHLKRLSQPIPPINYAANDLNREQNAALQTVLSNSFTVITGGPGTGKTFLVRHLVEAMGSSRVILSAPTGKAASRLKELNPIAACGTLHSLLGIRSERDFLKEGSYLSADLIVIDECSMLDAKLFSFFLASAQEGSRVVLIGDENQLPPIESGSLFADLIDAVPTARLTQSMRSDKKEILHLADAIREGRVEEVINRLEPVDLSRGQILSCVREGPLGVNELNKKMLDASKPIPIMITRTDYNLGLYNGEVGVLVKHSHALFGDRKFSPAELPPYEYAYCLSVHKSQGSEFDDVVLLVPPGSENFGREALYTGVTRARKSIKICGDPDTVRKTLLRTSRKISGLRDRLKL